MDSGEQFLERHRARLSAASEEQFIAAHETFLHELAVFDADLIEQPNDNRAAYIDFFSQCQRRYLAMKEKHANDRMMTGVDGAASTAAEKLADGFGRDSYERVRDLKNMVDFRACREVVMVGSGAFPATLFWLHDHFPTMLYTGLDVDARCVELATNLVKAMRINNMRFEAVDGSHHDFAGADFVYVANHVSPKKAVLRQIGRSDSVTQVVVREPTRKGKLLAEAARDDLPGVFAVRNSGIESPTFLSYDLLLRRA